MATTRRVGPPPPLTTPAELRRARGHRRALPVDLLREASVRLRIMALLATALWTLAPVFGHIAYRQPLGLPLDYVSAASIVLSLALYAYARTTRREPQFILDLGLGYMVVTSLAIALITHLGLMLQAPPPTGARLAEPMISWIGPVVLMFAAIIPTGATKILVAGLAAVSMNPIAMLIAHAQGRWNFGPPVNAFLMHYPDYLLAGAAVVISHVVTQLGRQVSRAREMGSYQLGELLGRGGMGEVYRATHRMLARPAAIKLIRPEVLGGGNGEQAQTAVRRFTREAGAAASLRSPHTVEVYDFGQTEDETLYYVMELLEGMDLETLVREHGPLPPGRVIHILRQVCESLQEAHDRGLVHRDIKPANIHVGRVGVRGDFVKVLDFGLVKTLKPAADGHESMATVSGITVGTPAYMAPELMSGEFIDGRVDIYALGCVAYYMLTGKLVFEGGNTLQTIAKHLQAEPVPASERTEQPIPPALDQLVLQCLAKDPKDRPQNAGELARALAAVHADPWSEEQALEWWDAGSGKRDGGSGKWDAGGVTSDVSSAGIPLPASRFSSS